jgi:chromatin remodeling complex protein RSC6
MARVSKSEKQPKATTAATTTKKATKKKAAGTKKTPKKSNIPAIKRPRSMSLDSFNEYMATLKVNLEHRIGELEEMHDNKKCPHKAIQHLRSMLKETEYMQKRITPLIKPKRKQTDKKNNILMKKVAISPALAKFLQLGKGEQVSRSEVNSAITMYINVKDLDAVPAEKQKWLKRMNPGGKRNLQDPENGSIIVPDKALAELLNYAAYQKRVKAGKQVWNRKNKATGEKEDKVEESDRLTYSVVQHLLAPHFPKGESVAAVVAAPAKRGRKAAAPVVEEPVESESEASSAAADDVEDDEE